MGQEHGLGIAVPDLIRPHIYIFRIGVHVQEELCGIPYFCDSLEGVFSPYQRKERHRIKDKEIGTGHLEEIPHHKVRGPGSLQLRQAVKDVEGVPSFPSYVLMYLNGEILESVVKFHLYDL